MVATWGLQGLKGIRGTTASGQQSPPCKAPRRLRWWCELGAPLHPSPLLEEKKGPPVPPREAPPAPPPEARGFAGSPLGRAGPPPRGL